jgi:hypothetical protein
MRLVELFIKETTEEDRAIISLATTLYSKLKYSADTDETDTTDRDYDEYDSDDTFDLDDGDSTDDMPKTAGKIGDLVDTPLDALSRITIDLQSNDGLIARLSKEDPDNVDKEMVNGKSVVLGLWYSNLNTIVLNSDYISNSSMASTLAHELRHALDDYKSDLEANKSGGRYSIPKKKEHRTTEMDPYLGNLQYTAQPAEINARFIQVLNALVPIIQRAVQKNPNVTRDPILRSFNSLLDNRRIGDLFPEKEKSKAYKRLVKRGIDFIDKEMSHVKGEQPK